MPKHFKAKPGMPALMSLTDGMDIDWDSMTQEEIEDAAAGVEKIRLRYKAEREKKKDG